MALVSTGGPINIESDVALADGGQLIATRRVVANPTTVLNITCGPISTATGAQCGIIQLRASSTVLWRAYIFFTATAASQSQSVTFPINATYISAGNINVSYSAITDATTAAVSFTWR